MPARLLVIIPKAIIVVVLTSAAVIGQTRTASDRSGGPSAQDPTASLSGTIIDSMNQAVSGSKITIISDEQSLERKAETNDQGYFYIPFLPAGTYTLLIDTPGFATIRVISIDLQAGMNSAITLTLQPKGIKEVIDVKATPSEVDASSATIKYSIPSKEVESFPIIATSSGRSILDSLPLLLPGVFPGLSVGIRGEGLVVNGARPLANSFTIEGGDNNDYAVNKAASPFPNPDALREVTVLTNNYKADVGGAAGAVVDVSVKSGTNRFHGNARYLRQDSALGARNFFDWQKVDNAINSLGGQIGGPVLLPHLYDGHDRTHFFFDFERDSYANLGTFNGIGTTIPMALREGDFSGFSPFYIETNQPIDPITRLPFPGGKIPANRFSPVALYYLNNVFPKVDVGADGYRYSTHASLLNRQYTARVDHILGDRDTLTGVFFVNGNDLSIFSGAAGQNPARTSQTFQDHNLVIRETHSLSALSVNQFSATLTRSSEDPIDIVSSITGVQPAIAGFTGIRPQHPAVAALPDARIDVGPFGPVIAEAGGVIGGLGSESVKSNATFKEDLISAISGHTFKTGATVRFFAFDQAVHTGENGSFLFSPDNVNGTTNSVADFLLGLPLTYQQSTGTALKPHQRSYGLYGMDDWRLRSNLTLSLGVRYELTPPLTDDLAQVTAFRPGAHSSRFPNAPDGVLFAGDPDPILGRVPRAGYRASLKDFAPRLGLAYSPTAPPKWLSPLFGNRKSAIRAGFGMVYDPTYGFDSAKASLGPPFVNTVSINVGKDGSFANPFGSQPNPFPITSGTTVVGSNPSIHAFDPRFRTAYTYQYNLSIQRELPGSMLLELAYIGSNSFRLDRQFNVNSTISDSLPLQFRLPPYPQLGLVLVQKSDGRARYDSFQARLSRRFKGGLMFDFSYVFSKNLDNSSGPESDRITSSFSGNYPNDLAGGSRPFDWARSEFDRRHNFVAFYAYDLPAFRGRGLLAALLNRWQIAGATQLRSGLPIDIFGDGVNARPDIIGTFHRLDPRRPRTFLIDGIPVTWNFFFDPTVFQNPQFNGIPLPRNGNLGRNVFDGPGVNLTSLSIAKRTCITESHIIEVRADITNAFNHANFLLNTSATDFTDMARIVSALPGRNIQLSLKYKF